MAVAKMKKVTLLGHSSVKAPLTRKLQEKGLLQIVSSRTEPEGSPPERLTQQLHDLELAIHKCNFLLGFLSGFAVEKKSFLRSMMAPRVYVTRADYEMIEGKIPFESLYEECEDIDDELASLRSARAGLELRRTSLAPWTDLDVPLADTAGTEHSTLMLGMLPSSALAELAEELAASAPPSELEVVSETGQQAACAVLAHDSVADEVQSLLQRFAFRPLSLDSVEGQPAQEIRRAGDELVKIAAQEDALRVRVTKLTTLRDDILVLREHLQDSYDRAAAEERFYHTKEAFLLEGWTRATDAPAVTEAVEAVASTVDVAVSDPGPEDIPPVELDNPRVIKPFEVLTRLYGHPSHDEIDPTPFVAPFFFIFFGMALGDFGYGLVLALGCWWGIRHFDLQGNVRNFMHLLIYGGIGSMLVGVATGGYFGIEVKYLPPLMKSLMLLDPLQQSTEFMIVAVLLGVVQVLLGVILEGVDALRHGDWQAAVFDQATTVVFLIAGLAALTGWMTELVAGRLSPAMARMYGYSLVGLGLSAAVLILLQGRVHEGLVPALRAVAGVEYREEKKRSVAKVSLDGIVGLALLAFLYAWVATFFVVPQAHGVAGQALLALFVAGLALSPLARKTAGRVGTGAFNLYGMSGFIGDFLSYARLMAIGLATVLIGMVVNLMFMMVVGVPYFIGIVLGLLILVGGHALNLIINLLGAFVHPTRLQFVEFFGKFYEDGGAKFEPLAIRTKHLIFVSEESRQRQASGAT